MRILIKILVESHMAFNWEIKSTLDSTRRDRPAVKVKVALPLFKALHGNAIFRLVCSAHAHKEVEQP